MASGFMSKPHRLIGTSSLGTSGTPFPFHRVGFSYCGSSGSERLCGISYARNNFDRGLGIKICWKFVHAPHNPSTFRSDNVLCKASQHAPLHSCDGCWCRAGFLDGRELGGGYGLTPTEELKDVIRKLHG